MFTFFLFSRWHRYLQRAYIVWSSTYIQPTDCQRTACSYLLNARIACIVCCRTSVVTKLSVSIQYITGSWQIQWSICYHTHQVHWLRGKWLQIGSVCERCSEIPRCLSVFPESPFWSLDELDSLISKNQLSVYAIITFSLVFTEKLDMLSNIFIFLRKRFQNIISSPHQRNSWSDCHRKWAVENWNRTIWSFILKIVVFNLN